MLAKWLGKQNSKAAALCLTALFSCAQPMPTRASETPPLAAPSRQVELPALPSGQNDLILHISTTDEDQARKEEAGLTSPAASGNDGAQHRSPPTSEEQSQEAFPLSDENWRAANSRDPEAAQGAPLRIRLPGLPDVRVAPTPPAAASAPPSQEASHSALIERFKQASDEKESKERAQKNKAAKNAKAPRTPEEEEAYAAIKAYRQQQLNAIKSDQQTLKALQDAISALGYDKQLGYMGGNLSGDPATKSGTPKGSAAQAAETTVAPTKTTR